MAAAAYAVHRDVHAVVRDGPRRLTAPVDVPGAGSGRPGEARTPSFGPLGEQGPARPASARATAGSPPKVHKLFAEPGTGVSEDTTLPVPPHRTPPSAQENR
ncbi:hypothetical protein [Streptomyces xanthochromogenes]|uniref:Uncharacterized protein n=1 Tax=Streptomyces xanthochromogenes TaxID=67384 RepID=A0ABQ3ALG8_9ACTN|nr:hypothetical protein [Streptomyces xanthochromogenes]GGY57798.1 hypothetical protein GCM10010326_60480 [Streptomyces xanthochromogenes]